MKHKAPLLILAAGAAVRMGMPKGLAPVNGGTLLDYQLKHSSPYFQQIHIVTGAHHKKYCAAFPNLRFIKNPHWKLGPFSSLITGLRQIPHQHGLWILPIDCPSPSPTTWEMLFAQQGPVIKPTYQGQGGHPVFLSTGIIKKLLQVNLNSPDARLDRQLKKLNPQQITRVPVDDRKVSLNLNTPESLLTIDI